MRGRWLALPAALFLAAFFPTTALAGKDDAPLYKVGAVVRARCDGGPETKWMSLYSTPWAEWSRFGDPIGRHPKPVRRVLDGTRLRVVWTMRHEDYLLGVPYLNLQILKVEPIGGGWTAYTDSLRVDVDEDIAQLRKSRDFIPCSFLDN